MVQPVPNQGPGDREAAFLVGVGAVGNVGMKPVGVGFLKFLPSRVVVQQREVIGLCIIPVILVVGGEFGTME